MSGATGGRVSNNGAKRSHSKRLDELEAKTGALLAAIETHGYSLTVGEETVQRPPMLQRMESIDMILTRLINVLTSKGVITPREMGLQQKDEPRIVVPGRGM